MKTTDEKSADYDGDLGERAGRGEWGGVTGDEPRGLRRSLKED